MIMPLSFSLSIEEPEEGSFISGLTNLEVNYEERNLEEMNIFWNSESDPRSWKELASFDLEEDQSNVSTELNFSELPESDGFYLRVDGRECPSEFVCWTVTEVIQIGVDDTPPEIRDPWLIVENWGNENKSEKKLEVTADSLSEIKNASYPIVDKDGEKYTLNLTEDLNRSSDIYEKNIEFIDEAGNKKIFELKYELTDSELEFQSGDIEEQLYIKKDEITNLGEDLLYYELNYGDIGEADLIEEDSFIGGIEPGENDSVESSWDGDWLEKSTTGWEQDKDEISTQNKVHFEKEVTLQAHENLPGPIEFYYNPETGDLNECREVEIEQMKVSLDKNETGVFSAESTANCLDVRRIDIREEHIEGEEEIILSFEEIINHFPGELLVSYELDPEGDIEGYGCIEESDFYSCKQVLNVSDSGKNSVEFVLTEVEDLESLEEDEELVEDGSDIDEGVRSRFTGYFKGGLGGNLILQLLLGSLVFVVLIIILHERRSTESEKGLMGN